jgi:hypothetical protein
MMERWSAAGGFKRISTILIFSSIPPVAAPLIQSNPANQRPPVSFLPQPALVMVVLPAHINKL